MTVSDEDEEERPTCSDRSGLHVMAEQCSTCIFRPGNLMSLRGGRVKGMVSGTDQDDTNVVCHKTLDWPVAALCRGSVDRRPGQIVRIAERLGMVVLIEMPVTR